ncbi:MAG: hypothetical protein H7Z19_18940 [Chitinophagaceae bacterium]|nr:hypothetical protein [Rubrivivax sp.]
MGSVGDTMVMGDFDDDERELAANIALTPRAPGSVRQRGAADPAGRRVAVAQPDRALLSRPRPACSPGWQKADIAQAEMRECVDEQTDFAFPCNDFCGLGLPT